MFADIKEIYNLRLPEVSDALKLRIKQNWDMVAKPLDGLGLFEDMICTVGAAQGTEKPELSPRALIIMCADNGIVEEGVSQSGQEVTLAVAKNMARGKSSACRMADQCGCDVIPVDIGINSDEPFGLHGHSRAVHPVLNRKILHGTRNFAKEPAMHEEECLKAICQGIELVRDLSGRGYRILATGEMGIGNTTTSTAAACALLGLAPEETAGRGAGLNDEGLKRKIRVIRNALDHYGLRAGAFEGSKTGPEQTFEILRCVGGLDIAGLCGVFLGGAICRIPVVIDGLISSVAALCAQRLVPGACRYMLASHCGKEPAMKHILKELGLKAPIEAGMALGEGTGALTLFPLLDMALSVYETSGSFEDIGVRQYERHQK